ncbi:MAG TPA: hypothetical protein VL200_14520 [Lacunisphaera sp.]|jgi:hypothetical protein|nr:hypothetical protein [Lacunisphaera sp.]
MSSMRMPPQVFRLVLLTLGIVGSYAGMRLLLKPKSFGEYGHYRGAALVEATQHDPVFAGAKACMECHEEVFTLRDQHEHRRISCESCHGPSREHARNPDVKLAAFPALGCMRCHSPDAARPATQKQIDVKDHFEGKCLDCHLPHNPKESPP